MAKLTHEKTGRTVEVPAERVEYFTSKGWKAEGRNTAKKAGASSSKSDD